MAMANPRVLDFVFMMETSRKGQGDSNRSSDGFLRDTLGCGWTVASSGGFLGWIVSPHGWIGSLHSYLRGDGWFMGLRRQKVGLWF